MVNATIDREENITEHWITQPLDHFDRREPCTWQMRYLADLTYWRPGGALVLLLAGESILYNEYLLFPFYDNFAAMVGGAKIGVEHRYYGKSIPLKTWNVQNLQYLHSLQALEDLKNLIVYLKSLDHFKHSKVVLFGASYAGSLAAWMRLRHPALVDAVLVSGAPVLAQLDFSGYFPAVGKVIKRFNPECYQSILEQFSRYEDLLKTPKGIRKLKKEYNICNYTDMTLPHNIGLFILNKLRPYIHFVQYGAPEDIQICFKEYEIKNYAKYEFWNGECNDYDFNRTEYFDNYQHDDIAWMYQTCNEFGFYQTTTTIEPLFTARITLNMYIDMCRHLFGPQYDRRRIEKAVKKTNNRYNGMNLSVDKVFYLQGDMDPWRLLGFTEDVSAEAPARVLVNQSHGAGFFDGGRDVPDGNFVALALAFNKLKGWINEKDTLYSIMSDVLSLLGIK